jgi:hypothetical protein
MKFEEALEWVLGLAFWAVMLWALWHRFTGG